MNTPAADNPALQPTRDRLDRLEAFLRDDPGNPSLLTEAFETALRCSAFERAEFHLRHGLALDAEPWAWRLKEGDLLLAQKRYDDAQTVLLALQAHPHAPRGLAPVLLHNLAYIDLQRGDHAACVQRLAPLMQNLQPTLEPDGVLLPSLQTLWLRALHRHGELDRAIGWAHQADGAGALTARAAGVASLIALDRDDLPSAQRWSHTALTQGREEDQPLEALNVQAALALGQGDPGQARQLATAALHLQPEDGRSWSVLAFASMLAGQLDLAQQQFTRALAAMPGHIGTWHGLAWVQLLKRQLPQAQASFDTALGMDRNFAESHGGLAVALALQQHNSEAQAHIERALRLDKACLSAQYAQAILRGETQDVERFQRMVTRLLGGRASGVGQATLLDQVDVAVRRP